MALLHRFTFSNRRYNNKNTLHKTVCLECFCLSNLPCLPSHSMWALQTVFSLKYYWYRHHSVVLSNTLSQSVTHHLLLLPPFHLHHHSCWKGRHPLYRIWPNYRTCPYKCTVKQFHCLQITASVLFVYYFIKAYVVGTHLNCIDSSMQFKWVPTTYAFYKENQKKETLQ